MQVMAAFHDLDETLLTAWKDSGIESGLEVLYEATSRYDNLITTISNVFQGRRGGVDLGSAGRRKYLCRLLLLPPFQRNTPSLPAPSIPKWRGNHYRRRRRHYR